MFKIKLGTLGESEWKEQLLDSYHEAILVRLDHFCGSYEALTTSELPAFGFSLGEANCQKVELAKMALNSLQELRNIKKRNANIR